MIFISTLRSASRRVAAAVALLGVAATQVCAQTAVTGWTLSTSDAPETREYSNTFRFENTTRAVSTFSTAGATYYLHSTGDAAYIRRNTDSSGNGTHNQAGTDNNNFTSTWVASGSNRPMGTQQDSLNSLLMNNNIIQGSDNLFVNSNNTSTLNAGNVERVDFAWTSGVVASAQDGITVFDRGVQGAHDAFKIVVFTGWDPVTNTPTTYSGNAVTVASTHYGNNLDIDPAAGVTTTTMSDYYIMRFNNGDNTSVLNDWEVANNQGIGGTFVSFANLGISSGTTVYGYSIMAADTVTNNLSNLVDWRNANYYGTSTVDTSGGIDLVGFNGRIARPVPEPSTYGALLMGTALALFGAHRWRQNKARCAAQSR